AVACASTTTVRLDSPSGNLPRSLLCSSIATFCAMVASSSASKLLSVAGVPANVTDAEPGGHPSSRRLNGISAVVSPADNNCYVRYLPHSNFLSISPALQVQ